MDILKTATELMIDAIALVDVGDNPGALMTLAKRRRPLPPVANTPTIEVTDYTKKRESGMDWNHALQDSLAAIVRGGDDPDGSVTLLRHLELHSPSVKKSRALDTVKKSRYSSDPNDVYGEVHAFLQGQAYELQKTRNISRAAAWVAMADPDDVGQYLQPAIALHKWASEERGHVKRRPDADFTPDPGVTRNVAGLASEAVSKEVAEVQRSKGMSYMEAFSWAMSNRPKTRVLYAISADRNAMQMTKCEFADTVAQDMAKGRLDNREGVNFQSVLRDLED